MRESGLRGVRLGTVDHLRRHVDADDTSGRTDLSSGEEGVESGATPEVEDAFARSEASDSLRVAAAQTQIGAFRHGGEVGVGVAELSWRKSLSGRSSYSRRRNNRSAFPASRRLHTPVGRSLESGRMWMSASFASPVAFASTDGGARKGRKPNRELQALSHAAPPTRRVACFKKGFDGSRFVRTGVTAPAFSYL